jgi:diguanylate cyclase (GGDEF)-like protein
LQSLTTQGATAIANARLLEQIRHNALHDPLTGLANRALILDRLEQMLARNYRAPAPVAVLFVDLDGFKNINDTLGHDAGDDVIRAVAARLCTAVREADTIGRLGGDEFVILLEGSTTGASLTHVAERVLAVLAEPLAGERFSGKPLALSASVGIATGVRTSAGELLRDADVALYNAKAAGKSRYVLFQPQMQTSAQQRLLLETDLRKALPDGQLFLVFQPVYDLASNKVAAVEALPRWRHPARGVLEADDFIPVIQETEAIIEVGGWVLDTACAAANRLRQGGRHLVICVAVSIRELESEDFLRRVQHALTSSGLDPALLMLEITETALMRRATDLAPRLQRLRALGVRVAIDHFGVGYSSLACLRQLPVDTIKLDNSLVSALPGSDDSQAIVHSLVQLGKALRLDTIAEDTQEPEQWPRRQRESSQNHLAARPYDIDELTNFLHQEEP